MVKKDSLKFWIRVEVVLKKVKDQKSKYFFTMEKRLPSKLKCKAKNWTCAEFAMLSFFEISVF